MKKIITCLLAVSLIGALQAQRSSVSITVTGNRIKQIKVDEGFYSVNNTGATEEKQILVNDLQPGQHSLELYRSAYASGSALLLKRTFTLQPGYDLGIVISHDGALTMTEKRQRLTDRENDRDNAIGQAAFNRLYRATRALRSSAARSNYLENEFGNTSRMYTTAQAAALIQLVNAESLRLKLAKLVYIQVVDAENFSTVSNLLNSTSSRSELSAYIASLPANQQDDDLAHHLSTDEFNEIYREVYAESSAVNRVYYLQNLFSGGLYMYSTAQASQFLQLIPAPADRLSLAKTAYQWISDKENFNNVINLMATSQDRAALQAYVSGYHNDPGKALTQAAFSRIYQQAYDQPGQAARYTAVMNAFTTQGYLFTASQARQLIWVVDDEGQRLELSKRAYPVMVDKTNYALLNDLFASEGRKREWYNYANGVTAVAMSDTEYNKLYRDIQYTYGIGAKYAALRDVFANEKYRFTVAQTRQLITLVSLESNRLELAKLSYNNLTDPFNVAELYSVFSSQASRDELAAYIGNAYVR